MSVSNLGEVHNVLTVAFDEEPDIARAVDGTTAQISENVGGGPGEYSAPANRSVRVDLPVCSTSRLEVRGDGETDLDFTITDASGNTIFSDFDLSDVAYATLTAGAECETFAMEVSNLGDVSNVFSVALTDATELGGVSGPGEYSIAAESATKVLLRMCSATTVYARGDGDTDLDFSITDPQGEYAHSDYDLTDQTEFSVDPGAECADYSMSVNNLGDVHNVLTITYDTPPDIPEVDKAEAAAEPVREPSPLASQNVGSGPGAYRAPANGAVTVDLPICGQTFLSVEGDGDTDLDYVILSSSEEQVYSDFGLTDKTYTRLSPAEGECETFSMAVENLGDVYNVFTVEYAGGDDSEAPAAAAMQTSVDVPDDTISTDGFNRNIAILNRTGESLNSVFWSNSATFDWGDDKLGDASVLAVGQQWNIYAGDSSNACLFDFKAVTGSGREITQSDINICEVTSVTFE